MQYIIYQPPAIPLFLSDRNRDAIFCRLVGGQRRQNYCGIHRGDDDVLRVRETNHGIILLSTVQYSHMGYAFTLLKQGGRKSLYLYYIRIYSMEEEDDWRWGWTEGIAFRRYAREKHRRLGIEGEDGSFNLKQVNEIYYIKKRM